jgi:hypothetical protein
MRWHVLALVVLLCACRGRSTRVPTVDWKVQPGVPAESSALLILDGAGQAKVLCLPGRTPSRLRLPEVALSKFLDVGWRAGPVVAGRAAPAAGRRAHDDLVLVLPDGRSRKLADDVRTARFAPDAGALAYEVAGPGNGQGSPVPPATNVLELDTSALTRLAAFANPLWEADGQHLRGTRVRTAGETHDEAGATWTSLRVRWDRESARANREPATTIDGPGAAQIPAPAGGGVAWVGIQRGRDEAGPCTVFLSPQGGIPHTAVGDVCAGIADDRAMRWSPDGRWLAFAHPGRLPGQPNPGGFFVDVVGIEGGRYPALWDLQRHARPDQLAIVPRPAPMWFDWSPSGRFLAAQDGSYALRVYDFEAHGVADLGPGRKPLWSPNGTYLVMLATRTASARGPSPPGQEVRDEEGSVREAVVLSGSAPGARIDLGPARDVRWLPAAACASDSPSGDRHIPPAVLQ